MLVSYRPLHCFVYEPAHAAAAIGINVSSLPLFRALYGDDDEPALVPDSAYGPHSPFYKYQFAIKYLEGLCDHNYPDVLEVLIARVEGRVDFNSIQDRWWSKFYGADDELDTDEGKAKRA